MNYRRFKKYIKEIYAFWEYDADIFKKYNKKYCIEEAKRFKTKQQIKRNREQG